MGRKVKKRRKVKKKKKKRGGASGKEPTCPCRRHKRCAFDPWVGKIPWRRAWQPTPVFLPGESHGQRSLVGLQSIGSHRVRHDWSDLAHMHRNWRQNRVPRVQNKNTHNKQSPREKPAQNPPNHLPGRVKKAPTYWPTPPRRSLRCQTTSSHPNHQGCQSSCPEKCFHSQLQIPWKQRKKQKISAKKQTLYKTKKKPNGKNTITEIKKLTRRALVEWRWWSLWAAGCTAEFTPSERERKESRLYKRLGKGPYARVNRQSLPSSHCKYGQSTKENQADLLA